MRRHVAIDLGASGGRVAVGTFDDGKLDVKIVHRFANGPVVRDGGLFWPISELWQEILVGLKKAGETGLIESVGVDSWAVDYALLDNQGRMIGGVHHYRDPRTDGILKELRNPLSPLGKRARVRGRLTEELYETTGIQFLPFNTLFQLVVHRRRKPEDFRSARTLVMVPDLIHFWLTGKVCNEVTNASTTQMLNTREADWSEEILEAFDISYGLQPKLVSAGETLGFITEELAAAVGLPSVSVVVPATHDTASAVAAVPAERDDWAFISSGTWSLVGAELPQPLINDQARDGNFTNEAGVNGTTRFLKNVMGLWLIQECARAWGNPPFEELFKEAAEAKGTAFDPDDPRFLPVGDDMPDRVCAVIRESGGRVPETRAEITRSILESLAKKTAGILDQLESITNRKINKVHIVGGGSQIALLNQLIANASRREVIAGPVEATLLGNILVQAEACGTIGKGKVREFAKNFTDLKCFMPIGR